MLLILGAAIFDFIEHYTHYYLTIYVTGSFVIYSTFNIVLRIGAIELPDVARLLKTFTPVLIFFIANTVLIYIVGWFNHDYNGSCVPYTYPPSISAAKLTTFLFNVIAIAAYCGTVRGKNKETLELQEKESEESKKHRQVYESMFAKYNCWCFILMISRFIFTMIGNFMIRRKGWIVCSSDGSRWIVVNNNGSFFITVHVIQLIMICVMTKVLLGSTAATLGLIPEKKRKRLSCLRKK